jgi:tetratricopeptide (TPR) repeat protein
LSAIQAFSQAIALKQPEPQSKDAYLYVDRGNTYSSFGDKQQAFQDYTKAIDLRPDNNLLAKTYEWRGDACSNLSDRRGAIDDYEKAINLYVMQSMTSDRSRVQGKLQKLQMK